MSNLEFINKEIESTQNWLEYLDFIKNDENIKNEVVFENFTNFYNENKEKLKTLQQIKTDLEAWEIVKKHLILDKEFHRIDLHLYHDTIYKEDYLKLKKALEVNDE